MSRFPLSLPLLVLLAPRATGAQEKPQTKGETPTFPAQIELVTVDTVVTDKKGAPVLGLSQGDFVLTEDGVPQTVATFDAIQVGDGPAAAPQPKRPRVSTNTAPGTQGGRSFVVVFDDIHLTPFQGRRAKTAVAEFLKTGVGEGDRVTLVSTGGDAWWTARMAQGRDELLALLKRLEGRHIPDTSPEKMSDYEAMRIQVYSDPQVAQRVSRRFESYGSRPRDTVSRGGSADTLGGDPQVRGRAAEVYFQAVAKNRITLEVMERVLDAMASTKGRKCLILVSEGFIDDPNLDQFKRVVQASRRGNCAIYFVDTRGLGGLPDSFQAEFGAAVDTRDLGSALLDPALAAAGSESLADQTGGFSVRNTNDLARGIKRIADESRAYYLIGYHPTNTAADGRFRKIQVKVSRKGLEVRARKGYYAPLEGGKSALDRDKDKKRPQPVDPQFQQALDSPYQLEDVPLRMTAYVLEETLLGKAKVMLAADVDLRAFAFEQKEGRWADTLEFLLVAAHRETGEYFRYDQKLDMKLQPETREKLSKSWFPLIREFDLAPGGYQAKLVVRDKESGKVGTVIHEFEVPDLAQLRASTPILSDVLHAPSDGSGATPRPVPSARRSFAPGSQLFFQYDVYGAAKDKDSGMPRVSAGYVVRRSDGTVLASMDPTLIRPTSLGRLTRLIGTSLEDATPGEYALVLSLRDEVAGTAIEVEEPFTVEAPS